MPCFTSDQTMLADQLDDSTGTTYFLALSSQSTITITFVPPSGGAITSLGCSPAGAACVGHSLTFGTANLGTEYTVTVVYSTQTGDAPREKDGGIIHPLETPTKKPVFKPVTQCPT